MTLTALICGIVILAGFQQAPDDWMGAAVFVSPIVVMEAVGPQMDGEFYYLACAVLGREVLEYLVATRVCRELELASFISIMINFFGWGLWTSYLAPDPYNWVSLLYYIWILWILIKGSGVYAGISGMVDRFNGPHLVLRGHLQGISALGEEEDTWQK